MNKLELTKTLLLTVLFCLLVWDVVQYLTGHQPVIPQSHQKLLATGTLLWFATLFFTKNSDDDWAGQW
ncbi:hypothetical protein GCM10027049_00680 [Mucilaginibacter puniceus]